MIQNVHDKTYRLLLSNKKELLEILTKEIPIGKKLTNAEIEKCNAKFVTGNYEYREADMVYRIKNTNVYLLIEHQSTIDKKMLLRTKEYCERIIEDTSNIKNKKLENLSIVVPIVLYTGDKKWDALEKYEGAKVVGLRHSYYVIDVNEMSTEELLNSDNLIENILGTEKLKDEEIYENILKIAQREGRKGNIEIMEKIIENEFVDVLTEEQYKKIMDAIKRRERGETMTLGERAIVGLTKKATREGRAKGIAEGRAEGRSETILQIAKEMIKEKIEVEKIAKVTKLKEEEIEKIRDELVGA